MAHCLRQRLALASLAALLLLIAAPAVAGEVPVYTQNPNFLALNASQNDISTSGLGNFATTYDNFTLGATTAINQVQWVGGYFNPQSLGPITQWTVSFYANNGGQPGSLLQAFVIAGNGGETFLQNDVLGDPNYLYTAAVSFSAAAGTTYWLSVVPDLAFPPEWGWGSSSEGNNNSYQDFFGVRSPIADNMAFSVFTQTTVIPEPGSLMLLGSGVLGAAALLRRKFKA